MSYEIQSWLTASDNYDFPPICHRSLIVRCIDCRNQGLRWANHLAQTGTMTSLHMPWWRQEEQCLINPTTHCSTSVQWELINMIHAERRLEEAVRSMPAFIAQPSAQRLSQEPPPANNHRKGKRMLPQNLKWIHHEETQGKWKQERPQWIPRSISHPGPIPKHNTTNIGVQITQAHILLKLNWLYYRQVILPFVIIMTSFPSSSGNKWTEMNLLQSIAESFTQSHHSSGTASGRLAPNCWPE